MRFAFFALALALGAAPAGASTIFNDAAPTAAGLQPSVDAFRSALGGLNAPAPVNASGGRREINWDGVPGAFADPDPFPGDFFNAAAAPRARGLEVHATGDTTGFLVSSDPADSGAGRPAAPEFGFDSGFTPFSANRLFAPIGGTTFDVLFFDPADQVTRAGTSGFGVVFTDVEQAGSTVVDFFDINDRLLESIEVALTGNAGLAFAGLLLDEPEIFRVAITAGSLPLLGNGSTGSGVDSVVLDDFIYGEPTAPAIVATPLPAATWLLLGGLSSLAAFRRRRAQV